MTEHAQPPKDESVQQSPDLDFGWARDGDAHNADNPYHLAEVGQTEEAVPLRVGSEITRFAGVDLSPEGTRNNHTLLMLIGGTASVYFGSRGFESAMSFEELAVRSGMVLGGSLSFLAGVGRVINDARHMVQERRITKELDQVS